ncbi:hypothetical protein PInf_030281 [Phytophthora infestans]|nr:hypothetical protein PInf_030281 [Phytophthora infestans]
MAESSMPLPLNTDTEPPCTTPAPLRRLRCLLQSSRPPTERRPRLLLSKDVGSPDDPPSITSFATDSALEPPRTSILPPSVTDDPTDKLMLPAESVLSEPVAAPDEIQTPPDPTPAGLDTRTTPLLLEPSPLPNASDAPLPDALAPPDIVSSPPVAPAPPAYSKRATHVVGAATAQHTHRPTSTCSLAARHNHRPTQLRKQRARTDRNRARRARIDRLTR